MNRAVLSKPSAIRFVVLMGLISLFADMTYEGGRSIAGPYFAFLGASGAIVGIVAGTGELLGYGIRYFSGYISDRFRSYWTIVYIGYFINLLAVPLLALTNHWPSAAFLYILERFGRAVRKPASDAMLSYAAHTTGQGWGFGLHEALDQIGAVVGPLLVAAILYYQNSYHLSFAILLIPALIALGMLVLGRQLYPHPEELEAGLPSPKFEGYNRSYWMYVAGMCLIAAGYVDFPLMAFHFQKTQVMSGPWSPILYALAMGISGVSALLLGRWFDRQGFNVILFSTILSAFFAPLVFWGDFNLALAGIFLWGIGMGGQESIVRAMIAKLAPKEKRAAAFGILDLWFGIFWFAGSALMGYLYDISLTALVLFSLIAQLTSLLFLIQVRE